MAVMMTCKGVLLTLVIALFAPSVLAATQRFRWTFGMTKKEVQAVTKYGPYRSFSNGDLETYNGVLGGHKQDFQFFFKNGGLVRIGIDLYEGRDLAAATAEWSTLHKWLHQQFGAVETPVGKPPEIEGAAFLLKPQIAPVTQPEDAHVFASLFGAGVRGERFYYVFLYFDPPAT